jgi:hypothetical protein
VKPAASVRARDESRGVAHRVPQILALALLVFQAAVPWTAPYFMTMDGPSHLYNARAIARVLFQPSSPYHQVYQLRSALSTNWGTVLLFNVASLVSVTHAEALVASFSVVFAFFCFAYLAGSISPLLNFLTFTWFLWAGYYNFYLGVALFALAVGFFMRHRDEFTWTRALLLAMLLVGQFFTHIFPAALSVLCILIVALWIRRIGFELLAAVAPVCLMLVTFVSRSEKGIGLMKADWDLPSLTSRVFASTYGVTPSGTWLYPALVCYLVLGVVLLRKSEWSSVKGGIAVAGLTCASFTLLLPSKGFGGDQLNLRVAWLAFILGCVVAISGERLQRFAPYVALYVGVFMSIDIYHAIRLDVRAVGRAVADFAKATEEIPAGARVARMLYPSEKIATQYGFKGLAFHPLSHADSWMAARRGWVALSDYQPLSNLFALETRPPITKTQRDDLWHLETGDEAAEVGLKSLLQTFPGGIDYVIVMGSSGPEGLIAVHKVN